MIRLDLPYPPSVNSAYANGGNRRGRHKTAEYKAWEQLAGVCVKDRHRAGVSVPYSLYIGAARPDRRRRDIGNIEKCVSDFLVAHGVVKDDCLAERITVEWSGQIASGIIVLVQPFQQEAA